MKAHDVRHLRLCNHCGELGDNRKMLKMDDGPWHDACVVKTLTAGQILRLPTAERAKITLGAAQGLGAGAAPFLRKLLDASKLELVV